MQYILYAAMATGILYAYGNDLRHRYFAWLMHMFTRGKDEHTAELKKKLFKPLSECKSFFPEFQEKKSLKILEVGVGTGENMDSVPDNSVDVVVSTRVMCSVKNTQEVVKQIHRVLVPGGKFFFLEHIGEWNLSEHNLRRRIQDFLSYSKIWPTLFDGCYLNRDMLEKLENTFSVVNGERHYMSFPQLIFKLIEPTLSGFAVK